MLIVGRVLDPQGKRVPNAEVMAYSGPDSTQQVIGQRSAMDRARFASMRHVLFRRN